jgi:hypothetical protein
MAREFDLKRIVTGICTVIVITMCTNARALTNDSRNDPFPVFTTLDPHLFLNMQQRLALRGWHSDSAHRNEWFSLSISPFGQNANTGELINGSSTDALTNAVQIGDLGGRWDMIALLFGPTPTGQVFPPALVAAQTAIFGLPVGTPIDVPEAIDPAQNFGFFSVPVQYRKRGIRFEFEAQILSDFGIKLDLGLADIKQTAEFVDYTPCNISTPACCAANTSECSSTTPVAFPPTPPPVPGLTSTNVEKYLMNPCKFQEITRQINFNVENFCAFSAEDIRAAFYWRHAFPMNFNRNDDNCECCPEFLLIPYALLEGSAPIGKARRPNFAFDTSFGSNDHAALGFTAGINMDFTETIEVGFEGGVTHFFQRSFCNMPMPTHRCQQSIFPFETNACVQPGNNYEFAAKMFAYHFIGCLSFYFQYVLVRHEPDCIKLKNPDPAFLPEVLEKRSCWTSQVANMAFNYDISPYISLGFLWQAPLAQNGTYRASTIMFGFNAQY